MSLNLTGPIPEWMSRGLCSQMWPDAWLPEKSQASANEHQMAKKVCGRCPVRAQCLEYALVNDEQYGVWGGVTAERRRSMKPGEVAA